jgi:hypothetical protein
MTHPHTGSPDPILVVQDLNAVFAEGVGSPPPNGNGGPASPVRGGRMRWVA